MSALECSSLNGTSMKELEIVSEIREKPCTEVEKVFLAIQPLMETREISSVYTFNVEKNLELIVFDRCEIRKYVIKTGIVQSEFIVRINKKKA